jgi:hypothetical protein
MRSALRLAAGPSLAAVILFLAAPWPAAAQWSAYASRNRAIADRTDEQVQPKIVARADGGCYVAWFDNANGGYDVYLQRLDAEGVEMWAHNGVLVADRGFSSTEDYGLAVDASGNALLAYRYDDGTFVRAYASKIDETGAPLWGSAGIQVSGGTTDVHSPKIAATADGGSVVAWSDDSGDVVAQKLDGNGSPQWGAGTTITPPVTANLLISDLIGAGDDVIVSWVQYNSRSLWAQKLAGADGSLLWGANHVAVFDGGSLQFGNFPPMIPDGSNGAVFAWYSTSTGLQVGVQHILFDGSELYPHNGVAVSGDVSQGRTDPGAAYDPASDAVTVFWVETNSLQNVFGLYGQRVDTNGQLLWGANGRVVVPLSGTQLSQVRTLPLPDQGTVVAWVEDVALGDEPIHASRFDTTGAQVWNPAIVDLKSRATGTSRLAAARSAVGTSLYVWSDGNTGSADLYGQNLNDDGHVGVERLVDGFESGDTSAWSVVVP